MVLPLWHRQRVLCLLHRISAHCSIASCEATQAQACTLCALQIEAFVPEYWGGEIYHDVDKAFYKVVTLSGPSAAASATVHKYLQLPKRAEWSSLVESSDCLLPDCDESLNIGYSHPC
jgi:hypothetical protein